MKDYCLVFWECSYCFPKNTRSVDIPTSSRWGFLFPHIQQWLFIQVCILFLTWEHFVIWICIAWCENLFSSIWKFSKHIHLFCIMTQWYFSIYCVLLLPCLFLSIHLMPVTDLKNDFFQTIKNFSYHFEPSFPPLLSLLLPLSSHHLFSTFILDLFSI